MKVVVPKDERLLKVTNTIDYSTAAFVGLLEIYKFIDEKNIDFLFETMGLSADDIETVEVEVFLPPVVEEFFKRGGKNLTILLLAYIKYKTVKERKKGCLVVIPDEIIEEAERLKKIRNEVAHDIKKEDMPKPRVILGAMEVEINKAGRDKIKANDIRKKIQKAQNIRRKKIKGTPFNIQQKKPDAIIDSESDEVFRRLSELQDKFNLRLTHVKVMSDGSKLYQLYDTNNSSEVVIHKKGDNISVLKGGAISPVIKSFLSAYEQLQKNNIS